ncbi:MAG: hypothetical protein CMM25_07200 [Rhodospirillaceae bacterium]|nr:hypothetical protein [Rhodospirillaceae bacterium]|tara:strand:- start:220 stop:1704 length:1485 start_codon:yes stop_codon:yes gene_type:complete
MFVISKMAQTPQKVHIVGAGPSGLSTAISCTLLGIPVEIYEKGEYTGGHHWVDEKNNTMHAPRKLFINNHLFSNMHHLLTKIGCKPKTRLYTTTYQDILGNMTNINSLRCLIGIWYMSMIDFPLRVHSIKHLNFNEYAGRYISNECFDLSNFFNMYVAASSKHAPANKTLWVFSSIIYNIVTKLHLTQTPSGDIDNDWHNCMKKWLLDRGVKINLNTEINTIRVSQDKKRIVSFNANNKRILLTARENVALCTDPQGLVNIIKTNDEIRDNWMDRDEFIKKINASSYKSIGFRVDFREPIEKIDTWILKNTPWKIITLVGESETAVNACVIDLDIVSPKTNKTIRVTPVEEFKTELIRQLEEAFQIPVVDVTIHNDAWYDGQEWQVKHTAVALNNKYRFLPSKGYIENIDIVTSLVKRDYVITTVESCAEAAMLYANSLVPETATKLPIADHEWNNTSFRIKILLMGLLVPAIILYVLYFIIKLIARKLIKLRK